MSNSKIGINIASMLPFSAMPYGLDTAAKMTLAAGYGFWQMLPLRSMSAKGLRRVGIPVKYVEGPWNATTWKNHLLGKNGDAGKPTKLQDVLFFPSPMRCYGNVHHLMCVAYNSIFVAHNVNYNRTECIFEVHKDMGISVDEIPDDMGLVLDLCHIREIFPWRSPNLCTWIRSHLGQIRLVHVQAKDSHEWISFARGLHTKLGFLLSTLYENDYTGDYVVEYRPGSIGGLLEMFVPSMLTRSLKRIRIRLQKIIDGESNLTTRR